MGFFTSTKTKSYNARKRPCLACFNMGAASPAYCWITIRFPRMRKTRPTEEYGPKPARDPLGWPDSHTNLHEYIVEKEVGLCWKHAQCQSKSNPNGILNVEVGRWRRIPFGNMKIPVHDEHYELIGGPDNFKIVTGPAGRVPKYF